MPRPPAVDRDTKDHPCDGCGVMIPPSSLRYCPDCRSKAPIPRHRQIPRNRKIT